MHVGLTGWRRDLAPGDHRRFLALLSSADQLGFDSVWIPELHFQRDGLAHPSSLLLAAAIAERTERMRIGLSVALIALHHPLLLAEALAQLDRQSGGRLDVGIGRGTQDTSIQTLGIDPTELRGRFLEAYGVICRAWTADRLSHTGTFWHFADAAIGPPIQKPHPPLYVAGYTPETIAFAIQEGLPLLLSLEPPEGRQLAIVSAIAEASGKSYDLWPCSLTRYVCIGATERESDEAVDTLLPLLHKRRQYFAARRGEDPELLPVRPREQVLREQCITGTPDQCIAQIQQLARNPGTGHLRAVFNGNGVLDDAATMRGMELFAREVLPACRTISPAEPAGVHQTFAS